MKAHIKHTLFETIMLFSIAFVILCSCIQDSKADSLYVGSWSHHFSEATQPKHKPVEQYPCPPQYRYGCIKVPEPKYKKIEFNETHYLIGYEHSSYSIGYFKNSFGDDSVLIDKQFHVLQFDDIAVIAHIGATYGYRGCNGQDKGNKQVCPELAAEFAYTKYQIQPIITLIPDAVTFGTKWKF